MDAVNIEHVLTDSDAVFGINLCIRTFKWGKSKHYFAKQVCLTLGRENIMDTEGLAGESLLRTPPFLLWSRINFHLPHFISRVSTGSCNR